ncbi:pyridoxamine 5'-phosphate oxidase family protein [Streptomyces sp. MUM 203J]|uniref:pyridoxamine 5'-phosphate oxidase family protein n=1 Tax=Streptomyces sp. MUM 203J TaxID=2791990 RepID=UPI001F044239|nr:pyridoxamine 5'-phosphate oxidase family protein [Streptomyces sp. MUM 203J]MCH0539884.1 pyridoxamine 5'-phosphate oxidase family protein [Streptomyces sp. MUM 203J]
MTSSWKTFQTAEPDFADTVRKRFEAYTHHVLGTLRKDGSPRLSGLEVNFRHGELWLGMMPGSRKADDLRRDPRFALHANPGPGTGMGGGDVRLSGRAVEVTDPGSLSRFADDTEEPGPFVLFRAELTEALRTTVEQDRPRPRARLPARPPTGPHLPRRHPLGR